MSIVAFKKKSVILFGANVSGKPPGGYWLPQGPFGQSKTGLQMAIQNYGPEGFSLNGTTRNIGYVGKSMHMSKQGTRFRGIYPYGSGGHGGTYPTPLPVFNVNEVIVLADQYKYVKPTVLTTYGMLRKRFRWAYNGQYPNYWVQPNYTGNLTDTASQGVYLQTKSAANTCSSDINENVKFTDKKSVLLTDDLEYNLRTGIATYKNGGKILNEQMVLTSADGVYYAKQQQQDLNIMIWLVMDNIQNLQIIQLIQVFVHYKYKENVQIQHLNKKLGHQLLMEMHVIQ